MRVLFAITRGEVGGAQRHLEIIASGLRRQGFDVAALVEGSSVLADRLRTSGVDVLPWDDIVRDPHPAKDVRARRQLTAAVHEVGPDILHIHSAKAGVLGRGVLKPPRGVTIFTCHHASFGPGRKWTHRAIGRPMEQLTLRLVDGIITVGTRDLAMLAKLAPGVPVHLVRNAVPADHAPRSSPTPRPEALWVARMQHPKDPVMAVRAWEHVVRSHPGARLHLAGTGPLAGKLQDAIQASPCSELICYDGFIDDLGEAYRRASVFLLTSHVEGGTTMATLEAMAEGLVPVVTDAGDAWLLPHHDAGVMTHPSSRAVGHAIADLFDDPDRLQRLRGGALTFARERYTPETMVGGTMKAYGDILRRASVPAGRRSVAA